MIWIFGPGRQMHYYAHLDRFAEFDSGDLVMAGDIVGYVGTTGNARGTPPHLHYGVYTPGAGALNPFPLFSKLNRFSSSGPHRVRDASRDEKSREKTLTRAVVRKDH